LWIKKSIILKALPLDLALDGNNPAFPPSKKKEKKKNPPIWIQFPGFGDPFVLVMLVGLGQYCS